MKNSFILFCFSFLFIFLIACSPQNNKWKDAVSKRTIVSYEEYLKEYPTGRYAVNAKDSIKKLVWEKAKSDNSLSGYLTYFFLYPDAEQTSLADSLLWLSVNKNGSDSAFRNYLRFIKQPKFKQEAIKVLSELVLFPYLVFAGSAEDMPPIEKLKLSDEFVSKNRNIVFSTQVNVTSFNGPLRYAGTPIEYTNFKGKELNSVKFGKLYLAEATGGMSQHGFYMLFYIAGTRLQRDSISNFVMHIYKQTSYK